MRIARDVSSKYTRSKVRKSLPEDFSYIIEELLHERPDDMNKAAYVNVIVDTIIETRRADDFISALCVVIQRLAIDQQHVTPLDEGCIFQLKDAVDVLPTICMS